MIPKLSYKAPHLNLSETATPFMHIIVNDNKNAIDTHITKKVKNVGLFREVKIHMSRSTLGRGGIRFIG